MQRKDVENRTILLGISGSHAYRTNVEGSDIDGRGIFIASKPYYLGFSEVEQKDGGWKNEPPSDLEFSPFIDSCEDLTIYELRKYLRLATDTNPNILELLWLADSDYRYVHPVGRELISNRGLFLSTKVKYTFSGYAWGQLKRIETHRKWLLDPPKKRPIPEDFGFDDRRTPLTKDQLHAFYEFLYMLVRDAIEFAQPAEDLYNILIARIDYKGLFKQHPLPPEVLPYVQSLTRATDEFIHLLQITQAYRAALHHWNSYEEWKTKRNPKRAETEARIGYDCYTPDTEFLTEKGWKLFDEIDISKDLIASFNRETLKVEYQRALSKTDKHYEGVLYRGSTKYTYFSVTAEHNMFVSSDRGFNWSLSPISFLKEGNKSKYRVLNRLQPSNDDDLPLVTDDYLLLIGCYVSEGSLLKRHNKSGTKLKGISLSQLEGGRMCPYIDRIKEWNVHKYSHLRKGRFENTYNIYNTDLALRLLEDCGEYSKGKRLPSWVNLLSNRQAKLLIDCMMSGDGTEKKYSRIYYTASKAMADSLQVLCLHQGWVSKVWTYDHGYQVYISHVAPLHGKCEFRDGGSIKMQPYSGRVVCFEVPNSVLITRLNGEIAFHGNSKHGMHLIRLLRMGVEILNTGELLVDRIVAGDHDYLMRVRNCEVPYENLIAEANKLKDEMEIAMENTSLPKSPNRDAINDLCVHLVEKMQW